MSNIEDEFLDLRSELKRISDPPRQRLQQRRDELEALIERLSTRVPRGERFDRLAALCDEVTDLLNGAIERRRIASNVERAKREREAHAAAHPTILGPERNAFHRAVERDYGYER